MQIHEYNLDQYDGLIFDFDGTLVNSMPIHNQCWKETFLDFGLMIDEKILFDTMGMSSERVVGVANERHHVKLDPVTLAKAKSKRYQKVLNQVKVVPQVFEILEKYQGVKKLGIVTGGIHEEVDLILQNLGLNIYFGAVICAEDTKLGKDSIEPYELVCSKLGVNINNCLFFDDGDVGLKGAKLAGMDVMHVNVELGDIFISKS